MFTSQNIFHTKGYGRFDSWKYPFFLMTTNEANVVKTRNTSLRNTAFRSIKTQIYHLLTLMCFLSFVTREVKLWKQYISHPGSQTFYQNGTSFSVASVKDRWGNSWNTRPRRCNDSSVWGSRIVGADLRTRYDYGRKLFWGLCDSTAENLKRGQLGFQISPYIIKGYGNRPSGERCQPPLVFSSSGPPTHLTTDSPTWEKHTAPPLCPSLRIMTVSDKSWRPIWTAIHFCSPDSSWLNFYPTSSRHFCAKAVSSPFRLSPSPHAFDPVSSPASGSCSTSFPLPFPIFNDSFLRDLSSHLPNLHMVPRPKSKQNPVKD